MTIVPAIALRSAERCPVNLAPVASRRPIALPTRVDAAIPAWVDSKGAVVGKEDRDSTRPKANYVMRHVRMEEREVCRTDAERNGIQNFERAGWTKRDKTKKWFVSD